MALYSLAFPNMFSSESVNLYKDKQATLTNLKLLLATEATSLFGDPGYGTRLMQTIYSQNDFVLRDLVIDEIYTAIKNYMPQMLVERKDISIIAEDDKLYAEIKAVSATDYTLDLYRIQLTDTEEI